MNIIASKDHSYNHMYKYKLVGKEVGASKHRQCVLLWNLVSKILKLHSDQKAVPLDGTIWMRGYKVQDERAREWRP